MGLATHTLVERSAQGMVVDHIRIATRTVILVAIAMVEELHVQGMVHPNLSQRLGMGTVTGMGMERTMSMGMGMERTMSMGMGMERTMSMGMGMVLQRVLEMPVDMLTVTVDPHVQDMGVATASVSQLADLG